MYVRSWIVLLGTSCYRADCSKIGDKIAAWDCFFWGIENTTMEIDSETADTDVLVSRKLGTVSNPSETILNLYSHPYFEFVGDPTNAEDGALNVKMKRIVPSTEKCDSFGVPSGSFLKYCFFHDESSSGTKRFIQKYKSLRLIGTTEEAISLQNAIGECVRAMNKYGLKAAKGIVRDFALFVAFTIYTNNKLIPTKATWIDRPTEKKIWFNYCRVVDLLGVLGLKEDRLPHWNDFGALGKNASTLCERSRRSSVEWNKDEITDPTQPKYFLFQWRKLFYDVLEFMLPKDVPSEVASN